MQNLENDFLVYGLDNSLKIFLHKLLGREGYIQVLGKKAIRGGFANT
jgi:hypothetical protein